jgi:hypothetical protein
MQYNRSNKDGVQGPSVTLILSGVELCLVRPAYRESLLNPASSYGSLPSTIKRRLRNSLAPIRSA